jgi:glycosyltransferase involved in cell wall biosynthesis
MRPLRIGVNALYLIPGGVGGTEIYLRGLLAALAEIDTVNRIFRIHQSRNRARPHARAANFKALPQPIRAASRPFRILWEQLALPLAAARLKLDVMLNPVSPRRCFAGCPQVTVFHDLQHVRHPEYFPLVRSAVLAHAALRVGACFAPAAGRFCPPRRRPPAPLPTARGQVRVALLGGRQSSSNWPKRRRPEPFLLAVSTLHPHKNLDGLLRAFAEFHRERPEFRLTVCGLHGFFTGPLHDLRERLGLTRRS